MTGKVMRSLSVRAILSVLLILTVLLLGPLSELAVAQAGTVFGRTASRVSEEENAQMHAEK